MFKERKVEKYRNLNKNCFKESGEKSFFHYNNIKKMRVAMKKKIKEKIWVESKKNSVKGKKRNVIEQKKNSKSKSIQKFQQKII